MNKETIYLDFDSTLVNSTKRLVEILNEIYQTNVNWRDIREYDCQDQFPLTSHEEIRNIFDREDFFDGLEFFDDAVDVLRLYENIFQFKIVTIGTATNLKNKKEWCIKNMPIEFVFHGIEQEVMGKSSVDMSDGTLIDDHIDNIRTSNAKNKILYCGNAGVKWSEQSDDENYVEVMNWNSIKWLLEILHQKSTSNTEKPTIISISGSAQHGKDSTANIIRILYPDKRYLHVAYGDYLKFVCKNYFGWDGEKDEAGRELLQKIGTDKIRRKDNGFWLDTVVRLVNAIGDDYDFVLITDARFKNEVNKWRKIGYKCHNIHVFRPNFDNGLTKEQKNHISEIDLNDFLFDTYLTAENLAELTSEVSEKLSYIFE